MLRYALLCLLLASFLAALSFFVRLLCAPFSPKILDQMKRQRTLHVLWGCWALFTACLLYSDLHPSAWPPAWWKRHAQRQRVLERVNSAGGWAALKRDCDAFADAHRDDPDEFGWYRGFDTNPLPPAIAALEPWNVEFYPSNFLREFRGDNTRWFGSNIVVRLSLFGRHSTGRRGQPALGLDVVCEPGVSSYNPQRLYSTIPLRYWRYRKVADDVYEFY
jgi:hypothetical protein